MNRSVKNYIFLILIAIILEVFLFNFRFWESLSYVPIELEVTQTGEGLELQGDGSYIFSGKDDSYLEITDIKQEIKNIYIDLSCDIDEGYRQFTTLYVTDTGNQLYYKLPQREIVPHVERSKYIKLNIVGESEKLRIQLDKDNQVKIYNGKDMPYKLSFDSIVINKPVPFFFSAIRFFILIMGVFLLYCLRYNTDCFSIKTDLNSNKQRMILLFFIMFNIIFALFIYKNNLLYYTWDRQVYTNLAQSLLQGRFDLPMLDVSDKLSLMTNPYDTGLRNQYIGGANYAWDYAYFRGKYYVYFGIVPCLILFLPLKAIFNYDLPVNLAALCFTIIYIIAGFRFIYTIIKRYFKDLPFFLYILMAEMFVFSSALLPAFIRNDLYVIPNITALTFTMLGLDLWLNSIGADGNIKSTLRVFLGSWCMALVAGCRPQFILGSFFAILIFGKIFSVKQRLINPQKNMALNIIAFIIPYIAAASFLMYYNYARFGSVTDFGAMYNLTTNDMTIRGFKLGRLPYGIYAYLFQLPEITSSFPYFDECRNVTKYMGVTIIENMHGGIFMFNPILFLNFLVYTKGIKSSLKEKQLFIPVVFAQIFAFIIIAADINMAGIVNRYIIDFTWLLMLCAFAVFLCVFENAKGKRAVNVKFAFSICFIISMACNLLLVFSKYHYFTMDFTNPDVFYSILYGIQFWM
ncbi:MAG: hypothetical protein Q4D26_05315 [Clostridia bacterium]|nr:hypothetical protein [Clostridia bacterium]